MLWFCGLFGEKKTSEWREAKCKKVIKKLWRQLKIQKAKKNSIIRQSSAEIALLLKAGHHHKAFPMVEQLYKDMCIESAYHQVELFSVQVCTHLPCIIKNSNLPTEVKEAVSSLIFAASRCGELHELCLLHSLLKDCYGFEFMKANIELLPGNHVNDEIKENLCAKPVAEDVKLRLISAIAEEYLQEQWPQPHDSQMKASEIKEMPRRSTESCCSSSSSSSSSDDCESIMSFSSESEDSLDSTNSSMSSPEKIF